MDKEKVKNLLGKVSGLLKSYEKIAKATGENFNIFSVMGMESNEVKTHSAIIGELLNPKGSHGLGDKFLTLFINQINLSLPENKPLDLNVKNSKSTIEEFIGRINEDTTEGGRVDILVFDNENNAFVIENKIYAGEQNNQLGRYNKAFPNAPILYLTLFGDKPKSAEGLEENLHYFIISYEVHILKWLEECVKEAVKFPMLREVIHQYINLIKKLTHQTMNNELKMEISELIKNNFLEASEIANNFSKVNNQIINDFFEEVFKELRSDFINKDWSFETKKLHNRNEPYYVIFKEEWKDVFIYIRRNNNSVFYGITIGNRNLINNSINILKNNHQDFKNFKSSGHSVIWSEDFCVKINSSKDVLQLIQERDEKLKKTIDFITDFMHKYENFCIEIANQLTINT